ncbi:hypothetical protein BDQ17DRAFT_1364652 [Cyathus striatus]|nr:hypothetical protein BDQ17DRAFT_1364652 [Cyathus striatus]
MRLSVASTLAALVAIAAAEVSITYPGGDNGWWVAESTNQISWTCTDSPSHTEFIVLIANKDPNILVSPIAILADEQNSDCSRTITNQQFNFNQPPATGYTVLFADRLNETDVFVTSQEFEIKALGSLYPSQVSSSASAAQASSAAAAGTSSASGSQASQSSTSSAMRLDSAWGVLGGAVAAIAGFVF